MIRNRCPHVGPDVGRGDAVTSARVLEWARQREEKNSSMPSKLRTLGPLCVTHPRSSVYRALEMWAVENAEPARDLGIGTATLHRAMRNRSDDIPRPSEEARANLLEAQGRPHETYRGQERSRSSFLRDDIGRAMIWLEERGPVGSRKRLGRRPRRCSEHAAISRRAGLLARHHHRLSNLPHRTRPQPPQEVFFGTSAKVPEKLALARGNARAARMSANRAMSCERCVAIANKK